MNYKSENNFQEEFYSVSKKNVLRGIHFQELPVAHNKVVTCVDGKVLDFFVDIRKLSSTYGKLIKIKLDANKPQLLYPPKGIAHGFLTLSEQATLLYKTDYIYTQESDKGILWSSVGLNLDELLEANIVFGTHLLEAMKQTNTNKIVNVGTTWQKFNGEYHRYVNLYAATKQAFQELLNFYADAYCWRSLNLHFNDTYGKKTIGKKSSNYLLKLPEIKLLLI